MTRKQLVKSIILYRSYIQWVIDGGKVPSHELWKRWMLIKYGRKYHLDYFVESGTCGGLTVKKLSKYFKVLYTIELNRDYYERAKNNLSHIKNINFIYGDSGVMIPKVLSLLKEPALFWLDAHYSGGDTAKGEIDTPIVSELTAIISSPIHHTIMIDDMTDFTGNNGYPLKEEIEKMAKGRKVMYVKDIMIIE